MERDTYTQPEKEKARRAALGHAVAMLTTGREAACCVRRDYVRAVRAQVASRGGPEAQIARELDDDTLVAWEGLHASCVGARRAQDLAVCYLCGPEPGNDFRVFVELGVLPQNIWAFESDKATYETAVRAVRESRFPYLKVHRGSIDQFLVQTPKKFDIIYIDACGAFPSKDQGTLRTLATLFRHHRLASPGVLVTTFAAPDRTNATLTEHHAFLIAASLYPKAYLECLDATTEADNTYLLTEQGLSFDLAEEAEFGPGFLQQVRSDLHGYYGQYVTRQIFDLAVTVVPWTRLAHSDYFAQFFVSHRDERFRKALRQFRGEEQLPPIDEDSDEDDEPFVLPVRDEPNDHPFLWTLLALDGRSDSLPDRFAAFRDSWLRDLAGLPTANPVAVREAIERVELLRAEPQLHGERLARALRGFEQYGRMPAFCDLPSRYLAFDSVVNQLAYPMHYVVDGVRRWRYQARATPMYLDVIPFDECRYLYEWLPTVDLLADGMEDLAHQLCYRFALDGLGKHLHYYHYFSSFAGTAVVPFSVPGFEPKALRPREAI